MAGRPAVYVAPLDLGRAVFGAQVFRRDPRRQSRKTTYLASNDRVIKLGRARAPEWRVRSLNAEYTRARLGWLTGPRLLDTVLVLDGSEWDTETWLHERFADERLYREWYPRHGALGRFFEELLSRASQQEAA